MIAVDGGEVWTDDSGGDGPPLVLLHPGVGDSRIWEPVLPALTALYRVIRYDARGYGQVHPARRPDLGARPLRPRPRRIRGMQPGRRLRARPDPGAASPGIRAGPAVPRYPGLPVARGTG